MLERVAKAIWEAEGTFNKQRYDLSTNQNVHCTWDEYDWKDIYYSRANAALTAMREPTQEMIDEGSKYIDICTLEKPYIQCAWQAMIEAALAEK